MRKGQASLECQYKSVLGQCAQVGKHLIAPSNTGGGDRRGIGRRALDGNPPGHPSHNDRREVEQGSFDGRTHSSSLSRFPISWPSSAMSNGHHLNAVVHDPVDQLEGKSVKEIAPSPIHKERPTFRSERNGFDPVIKFSQKRVRSGLTSRHIPLPRGLGFFNGVWMKNNGQTRHQGPRIFRRASLQETR